MPFNQIQKYYQGYVSSTGNIAQSVDGINQIIQGLWGLYFRGSTDISGVCTDANGNIYVTDAAKHIIMKIAEDGTISALAGLSGTSGNNGVTQVTCANARFNYPTGICCDKNGDLYIADTHNNQIRKISNNKVTVVAGAANGASGTTDGSGSTARFNDPYDVDIDFAGNLYVADTGNNTIRKIVGGICHIDIAICIST